MFNQYNEIFLQQNSSLKNPKSRYVILGSRNKVGYINKRKGAPLNVGNFFYHLMGWHGATSMDLELVDDNDQVLGYLRKQMGLSMKDFHLFMPDKTWVASVHTPTKLKNPSISVLGSEEKELLKCEWPSGGLNFSVVDVEVDKPIGSIRKRSMVYDSVKENLMNLDGYYIPVCDDPKTTLMMIGIGLAIDVYFYY